MRLRLRSKIKIEVKDKVGVEVEVKVKVKVKVKGCVYISTAVGPVEWFLAKLLFSQRSAVSAVRPIHAFELK